jgi:divalent metal cation (Fe/Co/Zn/Cd) transporter
MLQYLTITWNSAEFVIALVAGFLAGSIALIGFGFDSAIEVTSSLAALWRLGRDSDEESRERAEQYALRLIGVCFLVLACYVLYESVQDLLERIAPQHSIIGIVLATLSLIVMPWLAHLKRKVATSLESGARSGNPSD